MAYIKKYDSKIIAWGDERGSKKCNEKKRVLVVGPASPSKGGVTSYLDELLSSQLREYFQLGSLNPLLVKRRFEIIQKSHFSIKEVIAALKVITTFIRTLRKFDPTLVHIHTSSWWGFYEKAVLLLITKYIFKKKSILHIHGGGFDTFYNGALSKNLLNWILRQPNKTLIVSKAIKDKIGLENVTLVDNCVRFDKAILSRDKILLREKYGIPKEKTVFLSAALFQKIKGIDRTLVAFKEIHRNREDFYFIIAGEGPEKSNIIGFVESNKLTKNVRIMDYITGQEKEDIFLLADVFILNSIMEGLPITQLESLSYGLFLITTPLGIASDAENVFNDENCIRVPINDNEALKKAILSVLDKNIDIENVTRKNFYESKNRFDVKPVFEKMKLIYEEVLSEG